MPEYPLRDSILTTLNAQEPWPDNVKLFQPYEVEQILLPDNASCLAVQAFLKMCNLPFEVEMRWNAEFMSPSGRVPFIKCGAFVVSELEPIAQFAANKGASLCSRLSTEEKAEMRAYMSLITNVLVNAELYISWLDNDTFNQVTKVRNASVYPWPLGWLQTRAKRNNVAKRLKALNWHDKTLEQVLSDVEQCCTSLSQRLGDKDYFFGAPTQLDALLYGHARAILSAHGPRATMMMKTLTSAIMKLVVRMSRLTGMQLKSQEEYLLSQALRISSPPSRMSSERSLRSRAGRRKPLQALRDSGCFKPFASKGILMLLTRDGEITIKVDDRGKFINFSCIGEEELNFIQEVIEDILDKSEEVIYGKFALEKHEEKHDFEVIAFPATDMVKSLTTVTGTMEGFGDLGDGRELSFLDGGEDVIQIINDEISSDYEASCNHKSEGDGLTEAKIRGSGTKSVSDSTELEEESFGTQDSSNQLGISQEYQCGDQVSSTLDNASDTSLPSRFSSESKSTLKMPSDTDMSIENLLNHLRNKSSFRNHPEFADID